MRPRALCPLPDTLFSVGSNVEHNSAFLVSRSGRVSFRLAGFAKNGVLRTGFPALWPTTLTRELHRGATPHSAGSLRGGLGSGAYLIIPCVERLDKLRVLASHSEMPLFAHRVRLPQPTLHFIVQLLNGSDSEVMDMVSRRDGENLREPWIPQTAR